MKFRFFFMAWPWRSGRSRKSKKNNLLFFLKPRVVNVAAKSNVNGVSQDIQIFFPYDHVVSVVAAIRHNDIYEGIQDVFVNAKIPVPGKRNIPL